MSSRKKIEIHIHTPPVDNLDKYPVQINNRDIEQVGDMLYYFQNY